jgi:AcrR family transcriptional regulator
MGLAELDELRSRSLDTLPRGTVRKHPHLVAALDEQARDGELRRGVSAECHEGLEHAHAKIDFTLNQMKMSEPAPRKRPYRMSARADGVAATRQRLLAAAWRHFSMHPYLDVRLSEIASEAQVTVQTLHTSFGSKEQLFTAVAMRWGREEMARRDEAPVGDVRGAIEILFDRYEANGNTVLRMLSEEERIPAVAKITEAGRAYHRDWVARTFQPLLNGLEDPDRARRLVAIVIATDLLVWKLLRHDMQLDRHTAEQVVIEMVEASPRAAKGRSPRRSG